MRDRDVDECWGDVAHTFRVSDTVPGGHLEPPEPSAWCDVCGGPAGGVGGCECEATEEGHGV